MNVANNIHVVYQSSTYNSFPTTAEDLSDVFGKREVKQDKSKAVTISQLSKQLEESHGEPNNPFLEYSKSEGEVSA